MDINELRAFSEEFVKIAFKEKVALTLGDVELIKRQPETTYGKVREATVGATKGALAGSGVAALFKKNPRVGAAIGAGAYLMDRNAYGHGEKLASIKLAGIGNKLL